LDAVGEGGERGSKHFDNTGGFQHQALKLRENRAIPIRLIERGPAADGAADDLCIGQSLQLALYTPLTTFDKPRDLTQIEALLRVGVKQREDRPASLSKKSRRENVSVDRGDR